MDTSITFDTILQSLKNMTLTKKERKSLRDFCKNVVTPEEIDGFIYEGISHEDISPNIRSFFEKLKCKKYSTSVNRDKNNTLKLYEIFISFKSEEYKSIDFRYYTDVEYVFSIIYIDDKTFKFYKDYETIKEIFKWSDEDIQSLLDVLDGVCYHFQSEDNNDIDIDWSEYEDEDN